MKPNKLTTITEASELIKNNRKLVIAGEEELLEQLPLGNWIGGTIPYFMTDKGGRFDKQHVLVNDMSDIVADSKVHLYDMDTISTLPQNNFTDGFTYILIPGFSDILSKYALIAQELPGIYDTPLIGWVTGIDLNDVGTKSPKIFDGSTGKKETNKAIVAHAKLPDKKLAKLEIINIFEQGNGDVITFNEDGFYHKECLVNGEPKNLAQYIENNNIDTRLPLVADYSGAKINVSFQQVNTDDQAVLLYAPVRKDKEYRLAKPIGDYVTEFNKRIPNDDHVVSSFNCILNYLYSELDGKTTGHMTGPFTFGEIAYILINQTLVYMSLVEA